MKLLDRSLLFSNPVFSNPRSSRALLFSRALAISSVTLSPTLGLAQPPAPVEPPGVTDLTPSEPPPDVESEPGPAKGDPTDPTPPEDDPSATPNGKEGAEAGPGVSSEEPLTETAPPASVPATPAPAPAEHQAPPSTAKANWSWANAAAGGPADAGVTATSSDDAEQRHPARVPWKGTSLIASHALTTTLVGVGGDYQSGSYQSYSQGYALLLNYYVYENEGTSARVAVTPGVDVELTNSDVTDDRREWVFRDLPITVAGATPLYRSKESLWATALGANLTTYVATSKYTRGVGQIATLSPRLALLQTVPLGGKGASRFKAFQVGLGLRYDHLFSEADVPVNDELTTGGASPQSPVVPTEPSAVSGIRTGRALQDGSGNTATSDVVSGGRLAPNTYRGSAFIAFSEEVGIPVELSLGISYSRAQLNDVASIEIDTLTGPVEVPPDEGRSYRQSAGVSAGVTLFPLTELAIALGYDNAADLDGPSPNLWYTPRAQFTGALIVSLDAIYERATGPARTEPFVLF